LTPSVARQPMTVRQLAVDFELDLDEALVTLWDAGFDEVTDIDDRIAAARVTLAHKALGLQPEREMRTLRYWQGALGLTPGDLRAKLAELGVYVSPSARVLPKGALGKLRRAGVVARPAMRASVSVPAQSSPTVGGEFEWTTIGAPRTCRHLTLDEVGRVHDALEDAFRDGPDPVQPPGVRDEGLLESAVHRAATSLGNECKYPSAEMVAAALLHSLIHNHPFHNGNKRTALVTMLVSLDRNGLLLTCSEQELFKYVLLVAQHRVAGSGAADLADREVFAVATWILGNSRPLDKGEMSLKWREMRRILARHNCTFAGPLPGNKLKIHRPVRTRGRFGRPKERTLTAHAHYAGEGRDVGTHQIQHIRKSLHLDDAAGYDSAYFYGTDSREPDEFIAEYRNILKRLARL
jgi:death-on-curing family protein